MNLHVIDHKNMLGFIKYGHLDNPTRRGFVTSVEEFASIIEPRIIHVTPLTGFNPKHT